MSITETDLQDLRGVAENNDLFLDTSKEISRNILKRLRLHPEEISSGLGTAVSNYEAETKNDPNAIRSISPVRASALYIDFLCYRPMLAESQRYGRSRENLVEFARGINHMSHALLRAEEGLMRGAHGQALVELQREASPMSLEDRERYVKYHEGDREAEVQQEIATLVTGESSGMPLLVGEILNMMESKSPLVLHNRTIEAPQWSSASIQGAEFAIGVYRLVYPHAQTIFPGVVI